MWQRCAGCVLLLCSVCVLRGDTVCDNGQFNIQLDLPDHKAYMCPGERWPRPSKVIPSLVTKHRQENSYHACMDTQIEYAAAIPNSGIHRPKWAKFGEYIYCPPQRWLHNLQHGGVVFLYHPCVHPQLKETLSLVARTCMYKHIITPLPSLSRQRSVGDLQMRTQGHHLTMLLRIQKPLALAAWCSTLEMSHIDLNEVLNWLDLNVYRDHEMELENDDLYQHLLMRPSSMVSDKDNVEICPKHGLLALSYHFKVPRKWLNKLYLRRRRAAFLHDSALNSPVRTVKNDTRPFSDESHNNTIASVPNTSRNDSNILTAVQHPVLDSGITASFAPPQISHQEAILEDPGGNISKNVLEIHARNNGPELPTLRNLTTLGNTSQDSIENTLVSSSVEKRRKTTEVWEDHKEHSGGTKEVDISLPQQNKEPDGRTAAVSGVKQTEQRQNPTARPAPKPSTTAMGGKPECSCLHESTQHPIAAQQRAPVMGQRKSSEQHLSTPRTQEATWAAASLTFLLVLLTLSVLYTQIYKKFRRSQSLYWGPRNAFEQTETVASVIKRRLQGHIKRKKKTGHRKSPTVIYESLSESSD